MKIIMFCDSFYPQIGGVEKHVYNLAKELVMENNDVTVIAKTKQNDLKFNIEGINVEKITYYNKKQLMKVWKRLFSKFQQFKEADIIHFHDFYTLMFWFLPLSIFFRKKIYITFHGYESFPIKKRYIIYRKICSKIAKKSIIIGEFINKWYKCNILNISYGGCIIRDNKVINKTKDIVYVGRLDKDSFILKLLESIKNTPNISFNLDIYGKGEYLSKINKYDFVNYMGETNEIEEILPQYKVCLTNGYLSILEAIAAECIPICYYDNQLKYDYYSMTPFSEVIRAHNNIKKMSLDIINSLEEYDKKYIETKKFKISEYSWNELCKYYLTIWR